MSRERSTVMSKNSLAKLPSLLCLLTVDKKSIVKSYIVHRTSYRTMYEHGRRAEHKRISTNNFTFSAS